MATMQSEGKTGFLKEFFIDNPRAGKADINEAWRAGGNKGTISTSLIQRIKREQGLTRKRGSKGQAKQSGGIGKGSSAGRQPQASKAKTNVRQATEVSEEPTRLRGTRGDRNRLLIQLEAQLDDLLQQSRLLGRLEELEETLLRARRIVIRSHGD